MENKTTKYYVVQIVFTKSGPSYIIKEQCKSLRQAKKKAAEHSDPSYIAVKERRTYYL